MTSAARAMEGAPASAPAPSTVPAAARGTGSISPAAAPLLPRPAGWRGSLGVLGGMGPMAGGSFVCRLTALTSATYDQAHLPLLLLNDPRIPDRSTAWLHGGPDPLPAMRDGLRFLEAQGVAGIAIPSNTAHLWFDALQDSVGVPILHIADAIIEDLRRQGLHDGPVGLMGTPATLATGLYQQRLERAGYRPVLLDEDEIDRCCVAAIDAVKANRLAEAWTPAVAGVAALARRGAQAVVLGCAELPLAMPHAGRPGLDIAVVDSIDALARAAIERMRLVRPSDGQARGAGHAENTSRDRLDAAETAQQ